MCKYDVIDETGSTEHIATPPSKCSFKMKLIHHTDPKPIPQGYIIKTETK